MMATEAPLFWAAPTSGGTVETYTVSYRATAAAGTQPNPWIIASSTLTRPGFRVVDLTPNTPYEFQVFAVNAAGPGLSSVTAGSGSAGSAGSAAYHGRRSSSDQRRDQQQDRAHLVCRDECQWLQAAVPRP
jgi:hypothetical protein